MNSQPSLIESKDLSTLINVGSFIASLITNSVFGALFWLIAANYYSSIVVGIISAVMSTVNLFVILSRYGLDSGLVRFMPEMEGKKQNQLINSVNIVVGTTATLLCLGTILISIFIIKIEPFYLLKSDLLFIGTFIFLGAFIATSDIQEFMLAAARASHYTLIKIALVNLVKIILLVLSMILCIPRQFIVIYFCLFFSICLAILLNTFYFIPKAFPKYKLEFYVELSEIREILPFSLSNQVENIIYAIPLYIFPLLIVNLIGFQEAAYFSIAWLIGYFLFDISVTISKVIVAEIAEIQSHDDPKERIKSLYIGAAIGMALTIIPAMSLIFIFSDSILGIFGSEYAEYASSLLRIIVLAGGVVTINNFLLIFHRMKKNNKAILAINLSYLTITLLASVLLIGSYGIDAIGIAWVLGASFGLVINCVFVIITKKQESKLQL